MPLITLLPHPHHQQLGTVTCRPPALVIHLFALHACITRPDHDCSVFVQLHRAIIQQLHYVVGTSNAETIVSLFCISYVVAFTFTLHTFTRCNKCLKLAKQLYRLANIGWYKPCICCIALSTHRPRTASTYWLCTTHAHDIFCIMHKAVNQMSCAGDLTSATK